MLKIIDSSKISLLATKSYYDLVAGTIYIDLSPSKWVGTGRDTVSIATISVKDPGGVLLGSTVIAPPITGSLTVVIPKIGGKYKMGDYKVTASVDDGVSVYTDTTKFNLCPAGDSEISFSVRKDCDNAELNVFLETVPKYKGVFQSSFTEEWTVEYPDPSPLFTAASTPFGAPLVEGETTVTGAVAAVYKFPENVTVKMGYVSEKTTKVRCFVDLCHAYEPLHRLRIESDFAEGDYKKELDAKFSKALRLVAMIKVGKDSGCDTGDLIDELDELLDIESVCGTRYNKIKPAPLESTNIFGCGITSSTVNTVEVFEINSYLYSISLTNQKGFLKITNTSDGCTVIRDFDFDWVAFAQNLLERFEGEDNGRFLGIFNTELNKVNPNCVDEVSDWTLRTLPGKFEKWLEAVCQCCYYGNVQVILSCGYATFDTDFISGVASSGYITIPIVVTGQGSVTVSINAFGISGSVSQLVNDSITSITVPVTYNGSTGGNDGIQILIPATFTEDDIFDLILYSDTQPPIPVTFTGLDLDGDNIFRDSRILGRTVTVFYNGLNRYLKRKPSALTYPESEWNYVSAGSEATCRDATVVATWEGGTDGCAFCIPIGEA